MSKELKFLDVNCNHVIRDEALDVSVQTRQATLQTRCTGNGLRLFQGDNEILNVDKQGNFRERFFLVDDQTLEIDDFETVDLEGTLSNPVTITDDLVTRSILSTIDPLKTSEDVVIVSVGQTKGTSDFLLGRDFLVDSNRVLANSEYLTLDISGALQKLSHINVSNVIVSGYVNGIDYEVDEVNGTLLWLSSGSIGDTETISVSYDFVGGSKTDLITFEGANAFQQLQKKRLVSPTLVVRDGTRTVKYVLDVDYRINYSSGTITVLTGGSIPLASQLYVSYQYEDFKESFERVVRSGSHLDFLANTKAIELLKVGLTFSQDFTTSYKHLAFFPEGDSQKLHFTDFSEISVFGLDEKTRVETVSFNDLDTVSGHSLKHQNLVTGFVGSPDLQVWNLSRTTQYTDQSVFGRPPDYSIDIVNGVLTRVDMGAIALDQRVSVSYSYNASGSVFFTEFGESVALPTFITLNSLVVSGGTVSGYTVDYAAGTLTQQPLGDIPLNVPIPITYRAFVSEEEVQFGVDGKTQFLTSHTILDNFQVEDFSRLETFVDKSDYTMYPLQGKIVSLNPRGNIGDNDTVVVTYTYPVAREEEEIRFTNLPGGSIVKLLRDLIFEFDAAGYVEGRDYTVNRRNGTISRLSYGRIALNSSVYLTYDYSLIYDLNTDYTFSKSTEFLTRVLTGRIRAGDVVQIGYTRLNPIKNVSEDFVVANADNGYKGDVYVTKPAIADTSTVWVQYSATGAPSNPYVQSITFDTPNLSRRLQFQNVSNVVVTNTNPLMFASTITYLDELDYIIDAKNGVITRVADGRVRWLTGADQSLTHRSVSSVSISGYTEGVDYEVDYKTGIVSLISGSSILPVSSVFVNYQFDVAQSGTFTPTSTTITLNTSVTGYVSGSIVVAGFQEGVDYSVVGNILTRAANSSLPFNETVSFSFRERVVNEQITFNLFSNVPSFNTPYYVDLLFRNNNAIRWLTNAIGPIKAPIPGSTYYVTYSFQPLRVVAIDTSVLVLDTLAISLEQIGDSREAVGDLSPSVGKYYVQGDNTNLIGLIGKEMSFLNSRDPNFSVNGLMIIFERSNFVYSDSLNIQRFLFTRGVTSTIFTSPHYSLDYICQTDFCLKCSANGIINDLVQDNLGRYRTIQKSIKLEQDVLKVIRDALGSNPYRPQWGSTVETLIGRAIPDVLVQSLIRETVINALNHLVDLQTAQASLVLPIQGTKFVTTQVLLSDGSTQTQTIEVADVLYQTLDPAERIQSISSVTVTRDAQEPTQWNVSVIILTGAQKPLPLETGVIT